MPTRLLLVALASSDQLSQEWDKMWYCSLMATDPSQQNKGHATFLMKQLFDQARTAGEILGLSTGDENNVSSF